MKLNQAIAVLPAIKKRASDAINLIYKRIQKPDLYFGVERTYMPRNEDDYQYPSESKDIQFYVINELREFAEAHQDWLDTTLQIDTANSVATASIRIDGEAILTDVPVTYLIFLEKRLIDVRTFLSKLPVLPSTVEWEFSDNQDCYLAPMRSSAKTKKINDFVVAYEATEHHPAQIKEVTKDVVEGTWSILDRSGAISRGELNEIMDRVDVLLKAVVSARQEANELNTHEMEVAKPVFDFLFGRGIL